jgi:hypothetical protein
VALLNWQRIPVAELRGSWSRLLDRAGRPNRAFAARNVRFGPEGVRTRDSFSASATTVTGKATSFYNWVGSGLNRLIYVAAGAAVRMLNVDSGADASLFSATCRGVTVAEAGDKALIGTFTSAGAGASEVRVSLPLVSGAPIDKAFPAPWSNALALADVGSGNCTEGAARFGYIIETRSGYTGKPAPFSGSFAPTSYTTSSGGRRLSGTISSFAIPADAAYIHPIRTRTDNVDKWYYEPSDAVAVPGGTTAAITVYFDTSDESLEESAIEVDFEFDLLTQNGSGNGPITPNAVIAYGKRVVYLTPYRAYASEPGDYQAITEALHGFELPGKRQMVTGFQFRQSLYILGPGWTYEVADNGDFPSTWANATEVSSAIGTPSIQGICARTGGDYVWVASESGLYLFNGSYSRLPISFMNSDWWERINWAAPQCIVVVDDYITKRIMVWAPIDSATEMSHTLVWDYARGLDPMQVDFAYYDYPYAFSAACLVKNSTTGEMDLWMGPAASGSQAIRKETESTTVDQTAEWESGYLITQTGPKKWYRFGGIDIEITGSGNADVTVYEMDRTGSAAAGPITLSLGPGETPRGLADVLSENFSVKFTVGSGSQFELAGFTAHVKPWMGHK